MGGTGRAGRDLVTKAPCAPSVPWWDGSQTEELSGFANPSVRRTPSVPMFTPLMATSVPEGWGRMQAKHPSLLAWKNSHIPNLSREPLSRTPRLPLQDPQGPTEDGQGARAGCPQCNILCPPEAGVGAWIWQHSTTLPVAGSRQGSQVGFGAALWWYCPLPPDDNKNAQNF